MTRRLVAALALAGVLAGVAVAARTAGWQAHHETASRGDVRAELVYESRHRAGALPEFRGERVRISVAGTLRRDDRLPQRCAACGLQPAGTFGGRSRSLTVRDLDGDGAPDVIADFYTGGAHCCFVSYIYGRRPSSSAFSRLRHDWGDPGYGLTDLDHDGVPELRSADDRFAYAFTCYACSVLPIELWHYTGGTLRDVTRTFPAAVRADARRLWSLYLGERRRPDGDVRGILAAYLAEKYLLGTQADGWRRVREANARGELDPTTGCDVWPCGHRYIAALDRFLGRTGYRR